ncbi:DUF3277 family protein [Paenibacillus sp. P26]|nr:DUF3277 family protein [Paenibacillus sp. P26]UUZ93229.1 DUF3277 family protein [Paenibacillus sp. P25]
MAYNTYSFGDTSTTILHPSYGQFVANGYGLGSITVSMTNDRSVHDLSADGTVMVSKIKASNGTFTIQAQQTSSLHQWLLGLYNYLDQAPSDQWASITIQIRSNTMRELITGVGVSFQKAA